MKYSLAYPYLSKICYLTGKTFILLFLLFTMNSHLDGQIVNQYLIEPYEYSTGIEFGRSVAMEGNTILVGAPREPGTASDFPYAGAVFYYEYRNNEWYFNQILRVNDEDVSQRLGYSLALDDDWLIVGAIGAPGDNMKGGKIHFFHKEGAEWLETQLFKPEQDTLNFGHAVAIENEWAVVGVPNPLGAVYIFKNEGNNWTFHTRLSPENSINFGINVGISGDWIIAGSNGTGAYIFKFNGVTWEEEKHITLTADSTAQISGRRVAISGETAMVGSWSYELEHVTYFEYNGTDWIEIEHLMHSTSFSDAIALGEKMAAIGVIRSGGDYPYAGYISAFNNAGGEWSAEPLYIGAGGYIQSYEYFGYSLDLDRSGSATLIAGMPYRNDGMGGVVITELSPGPISAGATNGEFEDRVKIAWEKAAETVYDGFSIFKEDELIGSTPSGAIAFSDYGPTPGKLHHYEVAGITEWGPSFRRAPALGWIPVNGELEGKITTKYGAGVDSVEMKIESSDVILSSSMEFVGDDSSYIILNPYSRFPEDEMTVSFWIKTTDNKGSYFFSFASGVSDNTVLIGVPGNLYVWMATAGLAAQNTGPTGISINDGFWHHLAITWQSSDGELNIIKDGIVVFTGQLQSGNSLPESGSLVLGQDQDHVGGGFQEIQSFEGLLDEVRIWDKVCPPEEIRENMFKKMRGDEFNLVSYWSFDDLPNRTPEGIAGNYAVESGLHGVIKGAYYSSDVSPAQHTVLTDDRGNFSIENIYYGEEAEIDLIPYMDGHAFDPDYRNILMSVSSPIKKSLDFIDTTIITVGGRIRYAGTNCNVKGVEILVDNTPSGKTTNSAGEFQLTFDEPGVYDLRPQFEDTLSAHGFIPPHMNVNIEKDLFGLAFTDTTRNWIRGKFGASCYNDIGSAEIIITSIYHNTNVFKDTIYTDANGYYSALLPAQAYKVDILDVTLSDMSLVKDYVVGYFGPDTVDLTWSDRVHDFTYREEPRISIKGWPDFGQYPYNVPILEQGDYYDLIIEVWDVWREDSCLVNQGSITIFDVISGRDEEPLTAELDSGRFYYRCVPDEPLILSGGDHPYQKMMQIAAEVGEEEVSHIQWALITGSNPRTQTFTATTPEIPFLILRDPPGDQSYSYLSKDQNVSWTTVQSFQTGSSMSVWYDIRLGAITGTSVGTPFFSTEFEFGGYAILAGEVAFGTEGEMVQGTYNSFTFSQEFSTSDDDAVVGKGGDVYVGASYVNLFALTDVLEYDWNAGNVVLDTLLAWEPESVESFFSYTETHIRDVLLPQLRTLKQVESSGANRTSLITKYENSINVWENILLKNDTLKNEAVYSDNQEYRNISFSAGAPYSASFTGESSSWYSYDYKIFLDTETAIGAGAVLFGVPAEGGIKISASLAYQRMDETNTTQTVTTGFTLNDDDPGDFFSINLKTDPAYGTPVFELFGGTSSNPWEEGTQPRDGVNLALNTFVKYDVPPDEAAAFILYLGNTSESSEEREYHLSVVQASNLDGAIIRVGGVVIEDHLSYIIPPGEQLNATMTVERGPIAYDYENLKIKFYAPGDPDVIYDIATFSVHFISPCSDVNLLYPENNWVVNASANDTLQIVINNYDLDNPYLERIRFQYRRIGDGWTTAYTYEKEEITGEYLMEYWKVNALPDGNYELRVVSDCGTQGLKYSAIAAGVIDRSALIVYGTPQPSDGILNIGEDISISFSGEVDPAFLTEYTALLFTADDTTFIENEIAIFENRIIITPSVSLDLFEDRMLVAVVSGIKDLNGNILREPAMWNFRVNRNPVYWTVSNILYTVYQGAADGFSRTLTNIGGEDESFTLSAYPAWLLPSVINGTIPPGGEQEITFSVNTDLNVGFYSDTVVAVISSGKEKLIVDLQVLHEPPNWTVEPANFAYTMNMTAVIAFDDKLSDDIFDIVSVYSDGEIRGIAKVEYLANVDKYMAFITIYSNNPFGELLTFRMWDASAGKEFAYLDTEYIFSSNSSLGTVNDPVVLRSDANVQTIDLSQGWTWFSLNIDGASMELEDVLGGLTLETGDLIKSQDEFSIYHHDFGWQGRLKRLQIGESYMIRLQNENRLHFTGSPVDIFQASITIRKGWNWLGHLSQNIMGVNETFALLGPLAGDQIKSQEEFANFMAATQSWEGSLQNLFPGEGYLLKSGKDAVFQYPISGKSGDALSAKQPGENSIISYPAKPEWRLNFSDFEYSMNIVLACSFDNSEMRDSSIIIAAFSDYNCRGVSKMKYIPVLERYVGFLTVYSNKPEGDALNFKLYEPATDKTREISEKADFNSNEVYGDLDAPMTMEAEAIDDELVPYEFYLSQNYPNPFNPETIIEYGIPIDAEVKLAVFNTLGQRVATLVNAKQVAHRYSITFDASKYQLSSGIYFYQLQTGSYNKVRKLLYLK